MQVKMYLDTQVKNNEHRLMFGVTLPGGRFFIKTTTYLDKCKFNVTSQKYSNKRINASIQTVLKYLEGLEAQAYKEERPLTKSYIIEKWRYINHKEDAKSDRSFFDYFDYLPEKYKGIKSQSTLRKFKQVALQLKIFDKNLTYDDLTESFYDRYNEFLITEAKNRNTGKVGLSQNTISKHWDKIRIVCMEAEKDGIKVPPYYRDFRGKTKRKKPVWLTKEECNLIASIPLTGMHKLIRDEWMARYYTGLRSSDMDMVTKDSFITEQGQCYLKFTHVKTRNESIIPIHDKAKEIFERYNYRFPPLALQVKNRYIKEVAEQAEIKTIVSVVDHIGSSRIEKTVPKYNLITTHTARRSFGRRFMESVGDISQLRELLGHSDTKTTLNYIGWEDQELSKSVNRIKF